MEEANKVEMGGTAVEVIIEKDARQRVPTKVLADGKLTSVDKWRQGNRGGARTKKVFLDTHFA
jgi:hypothetical protein